MVVPPSWDLKKITLGNVASVVISLVVTASIFVGAWNALGLPRWAWAYEMEDLKNFSEETRILLLEDQLWNAQARLTELLRLRDEYRRKGETEPNWLGEDISGLRRHIYQKEKSIKALEKDD